MNTVIQDAKALCFDFGNTLIEFGPKQIAHQYAALEEVMTKLFGYCDSKRLKTIRDRQIVAPFSNGYRENDIRSLCEELIRGIYNIIPEEIQVNMLMQTRYESFVHIVELPDGVRLLLDKLRKRYRLGLLSNYPCSRSIRDSLAKIGLFEMFEAVTISADVGYVKPHARPFETLAITAWSFPIAMCIRGRQLVSRCAGGKKYRHVRYFYNPVYPLRKL